MSDEVIKVLDALAEKFGIAVDWTNANVIPYLQTICSKYVDYEIATSIVWQAIGVIILISLIGMYKFIVYAGRKYDEEGHYSEWDTAKIFGEIGFVFLLVIAVLIIGVQTFDIVTCQTFPEKIIIDELQEFYNKSN